MVSPWTSGWSSRRHPPLAVAALLAAPIAAAVAVRLTRGKHEAARPAGEALGDVVVVTSAVEDRAPVAEPPEAPPVAPRPWRRRYYVVCCLVLVAAVTAAGFLLRWAVERPPRLGSRSAQGGATSVIGVSDARAPLRVDAFYEVSPAQPEQALTATVQVRTRPARGSNAVTWGMKIGNVGPDDVDCPDSPVQVTRDPDGPAIGPAVVLVGTATEDTWFTCTVTLPRGSRVATRRDTRLILLGLHRAPFDDPLPLGPLERPRGAFVFAGRDWYAPSWFTAHAALQFDWTSHDLVRATPSGFSDNGAAVRWTSSSMLPGQVVVLRSHRGEAFATSQIVLAGVLLGVAGQVCLTMLERLR